MLYRVLLFTVVLTALLTFGVSSAAYVEEVRIGCDVDQVAAFQDYMWIRCNVTDVVSGSHDSNIIFFAADNDHPSANMYMLMATTAITSGGRLTVMYDKAGAGQIPRCDPSNCRPIWFVSLQP